MLAADVLSGVLAFVFGSAAVAKLVGQKQQVLTAEKLRISWRHYRWIGVPEAAASAGLLVGYASEGDLYLAWMGAHKYYPIAI